MRLIFLTISHAIVLAIGFALGIYFLPILTAPQSVDRGQLEASAEGALFKAEFKRDLKGSDFLHWGEGSISVSAQKIVHQGALAPGPDYKLYLVGEFVEDEEQFNRVKSNAKLVGDVKNFDGFLVDVPQGVDVNDYSTVVIWCESFGEFITSAKYK